MKVRSKINLPVTLLLIFFLLFTQQAFALGKVGHKVICQVAFDHLSPSTQDKVNTLLEELPKYDKKLINKYNYKSANSTISFADTCTWADAIKKNKSYDKYKKWHYVNVARNQTKVTPETCQTNCVTSAVTLHTKQLTELPTSWKKLQAMMFLGHWLGDIHQPMHVNFSSDMGGNRTKISIDHAKCNNMHWLWDECLLYPKSKTNNDALFTRLHDNLSNQWEKSPIATWQKDSVYTWATESLTITRLPSVLYCTIDEKNYCIATTKGITKLPSNYQKNHKIILENRMLQASARLTNALEQALE